MDIDTALLELGDVDSKPLQDLILSQEELAWHEDTFRQQQYDVHSETQSIVMVFTHGDNWPNSEIRREPGWDRLADAAIPLMEAIVEKHYTPGGTIIRAMAAKLVSGGKITPHRDKHPSFAAAHRIHVPITTNPRVRFMLDGRPHQLQVGHAYEINNQKMHSVVNKGAEDRITFIFDYVPSSVLDKIPDSAPQ